MRQECSARGLDLASSRRTFSSSGCGLNSEVTKLAFDDERRRMNFSQIWPSGLTYRDFLDKHASVEQHRRWDEVHAKITLTQPQKDLLASFRRDMQVIVVAGAWCGDCIQQCPIFEHFASFSSKIQVRYFDRDEYPQLADELSICGGKRVPSVLFLSEDSAPCGRAGDRTLAKYRDLAKSLDGAFCPTGLVAPDQSLLQQVTQDWLNDFERIQLMLRLSPRLRQKHGD